MFQYPYNKLLTVYNIMWTSSIYIRNNRNSQKTFVYQMLKNEDLPHEIGRQNQLLKLPESNYINRAYTFNFI